VLYYNCPKGKDKASPSQGQQFLANPRPLEKNLKKMKKGLDKIPNLWYNKITKGEGNPKNKPERKYHYGKHC
jgi:hypothetical protein